MNSAFELLVSRSEMWHYARLCQDDYTDQIRSPYYATQLFRHGTDEVRLFYQRGNKLIVVFRGTEPGYSEWLFNLLIYPHPVRNVVFKLPAVHRGFGQNVGELFTDIVQSTIWRAALRDSGYIKIVFTGHSRGGALAEIASLLLYCAEGFMPHQIITFGQPKVGGDAWHKVMKQALDETICVAARITNLLDVTCRLPIGVIYDYRHTLPAYPLSPRSFWGNKHAIEDYVHNLSVSP